MAFCICSAHSLFRYAFWKYIAVSLAFVACLNEDLYLHNRKLRVVFEVRETNGQAASPLSHSVAAEFETVSHSNKEAPIWKRIDWCLVGVVAIFIVVVVLPIFLD